MATFQTKGFAVVPYDLMDSAPINLRAHLFAVYLVLHRRGWGSAQGCWASVHTIQEDAGVGRKSVHAAIRWLLSEGWVTREERPGCTSVYRVRIDDPQPQLSTGRPRSKGTQVKNDPGQKRPTTQVKNDPGPRSKMTHKQEPRTKTQEQEPSLPVSPPEPIATAPAALDEGEKVTPIDHQPEPAPQPSRKALKVTAADVPADLAPVAELFCAWWNHHKGGKRTQRALAVQLTELGKIQADARGGIEAIRAQLQKAITADEIGRRWAGITHDRWVEYGRPAALRVGTGSGGGYRTARERNEERLDEWVEFIYASDPLYANHPRNQTRTTTETIDWEAMPRA